MTTHPVKLAAVREAATAAQRRDALLAECALQRVALGVETRQLLEPITGGKLRQNLMARLKVPLIAGATVLGVMLLRPRRTLPLLLKASALLRHSRHAMPFAMPLIRGLLQRINKSRHETAKK